MVQENLIHVKFEYEEAVDAKRDFLFSQITALRIEKAIQGYRFYRMKELNLKATLYKKMKELRLNLVKLHKTLPKLEIPKILNREREDLIESEPISVMESPKEKTPYGNDVESQLREIQRRLDNLQRSDVKF